MLTPVDPLQSAPDKPKPDYSRLTRDEIGAILSLKRAGKTQVEIARIVGCGQDTVSDWLQRLTDPVEHANHILQTGATVLAKRVIKKSNPEIARKVLTQLGSLPPEPSEMSRVQVNVINSGTLFGVPDSREP